MWWPFKKKKVGEAPKTKAWPGRSVSNQPTNRIEDAGFAVGGLTLGEFASPEGRESGASPELSSHHHTADHPSPVADQQAEAPDSGSSDHSASDAGGHGSGGSYDSGSSDSGSSGGSDSSSGGSDS